MLADNLNAEIVLGSVTNVREALAWLSYTYLNTRLPRNPLAYGLTFPDVVADPSLETYKRNMIIEAAKTLKGAQVGG
jgi:activating signal cointegrator complex subunit 3